MPDSIPSSTPVSPYVGLQPYTEADREYFFGREQETETIAANLLTAPLTLLYGASGVGKSSVLAAGVVPYLRALPDLLVVLFRTWQDRTFLASLRSDIAGAVTKSTGETFSDGDAPLDEFLLRAEQQTHRTLLVILDQFEEYFLYHPTADPFEEQLARAVNRDEVQANFLLSLREDALSRLDRFETRIPNLMSSGLRLEHLDRAGAINAIRKPLDVYNGKRAGEPPMRIQDALVDALVEQVQTGRVILSTRAGHGEVSAAPTAALRVETPFLQMVLTRLWDEETRAGSHLLRLETLDRLGGAEKIVRTHLDSVMRNLTAPEQDLCGSFFDRLVTPSGTKIAQTADDLVTYAGRPAARVTPVLKKLADGRVLRPIAPPMDQPQTARYEIFHDVLAPAILDWRRRWVDRQRVRRFRLIGLVAGLLILLFAGLALFAFGEANRATDAEDKALQQSYAAATFAAQANTERDRADEQTRINIYRRLAAQATALIPRQYDLALLLGMEAVRANDNYETRGSLQAILLDNPQLIKSLRGHTDSVESVAFSPDGKTLASASQDKTILLWDMATRRSLGPPLTGHTDAVISVAFSPDGKTLASGSDDKTVILWDVATRRSLGPPLTGHTSDVYSVAFSPDGKTLASGSDDKTVLLWDVATRRSLGPPLTGHTDVVVSVAFSPDGKTLASGSRDNSIILWDVATRRSIGPPVKGHTDNVDSVAFSPDGKTLASGSRDKTIILWDLATRRSLGPPLAGHTNTVNSVDFSPDGKTLASGSGDNTIILWDVATRRSIGPPLTGHAKSVHSVAFSADGKTLASGSLDKSIILWDISTALNPSAATHRRLGPALTGHTNDVYSVAFSPDGKTLASGSRDKTIILWDVATRRSLDPPLATQRDWVRSVAFSPDGKTLASGSRDRTILLWTVATRQPLGPPLTGHTGEVYSVAFSPDGKVLASGSADNTILLWDVATRRSLGPPLTGHTGFVNSVAFSPDGKILASGSDDKTIILWDVATRQPLGPPLKGHADGVASVAFSPDGKTLASGSQDKTVLLWDVATRRSIGPPLAGHTSSVHGVAFSPDGKTLASGSRDNTIILWDLVTRRSIGPPLEGHTNTVNSVAFSPDGKTLASVSRDNTIILWDLDLGSWQANACDIANRNLTKDEWNQYINSDPSTYRATCPALPLEK